MNPDLKRSILERKATLLETKKQQIIAKHRQKLHWYNEHKIVNPESVESFAAVHLKDDSTGNPIIAARHHKFWLQFLCDASIKKLMIIAPYASAKTTWAIKAFLGNYIATYPYHSMIIACNGDDTARDRSMAVRNLFIDANVRETYPHLEPDPLMPWTQSKWSLQIKNKPQSGRINNTVSSFGSGGQIIGTRADIILADDLLDAKNTASAEQRQQIATWVDQTLLSRLKPQGRAIVIGTSWHADDFYSNAKDQGGWVVVHMPMLTDDPTGALYATITYPDWWQGRVIGSLLN
jgi:hypothetical protein